MRPEKNIEKLIKNIGIDTNVKMDKAVLDDVLKALENSKKTKSAAIQPNIWRIIMKSKITKLATAAVIIIGILIGIHEFGGSIDEATVAWGAVAEKVEQIQTFIFRTTQTGVGIRQAYESMLYYSSKHGKRIDVYKGGGIVMKTYVLPEEKAAIVIMPAGKTYQRTPLTEEQLQAELRDSDPREVVKQFMSMEYKKLGRDEIDYVEVEGIEVENPKIMKGMFENAVGRLWVDVETDLPVLIEIEGVASRGLGQMKIVVDKLHWDVELEASEFEPNIPADYTVITNEDTQ